MNTDNTLDRIDGTLTFYSAGLDADLIVAKDQPEWPPSAQAWFINAFNDMLSQFAAAIAEAGTAIGAAMRPLLEAMRPLSEVLERRKRWRRALRRWNEPDMRATMWDRKTARTSRAWTKRQVER